MAIEAAKCWEKLCGQYAASAESMARPKRFFTASPTKSTGNCGEALARNPRATSATRVAANTGAGSNQVLKAAGALDDQANRLRSDVAEFLEKMRTS